MVEVEKVRMRTPGYYPLHNISSAVCCMFIVEWVWKVYKQRCNVHIDILRSHGKRMRLTKVDSVDHDEGGDPLYGFTPLWLEGGDRLLGEGLCLQF